MMGLTGLKSQFFQESVLKIIKQFFLFLKILIFQLQIGTEAAKKTPKKH